MIKFLFYISIIGVLFFGCRKYPEDHKISFKSSFKRLTEHPWKINYIEINGVEMTHHGFDMVNANVYDIDLTKYTFRFSEKKVESLYGDTKNIYNFFWDNQPYASDSKLWSFYNNKREIDFIIGNHGDSNILGITNGRWLIKKLTNEDFEVETKNNLGIIYKLKFSKS